MFPVRVGQERGAGQRDGAEGDPDAEAGFGARRQEGRGVVRARARAGCRRRRRRTCYGRGRGGAAGGWGSDGARWCGGRGGGDGPAEDERVEGGFGHGGAGPRHECRAHDGFVVGVFGVELARVGAGDGAVGVEDAAVYGHAGFWSAVGQSLWTDSIGEMKGEGKGNGASYV